MIQLKYRNLLLIGKRILFGLMLASVWLIEPAEAQ